MRAAIALLALLGVGAGGLLAVVANAPVPHGAEGLHRTVGPAVPVNEARPPPVRAPWANALTQVVYDEMAAYPDGDIGVYALDLERGHGFGYHDDKPMYLASGVKLLFMVEAYRQREAGVLSFDEELLYQWDDVRDGAPAMNKLPRGQRYPVDELLLYMMRDSDNAAADLIAERIGTKNVQAGLVRDGFADIGPIVTLMTVRRDVYRRLDPRADTLSAASVRDVRWRNGFRPRLDLLKKHIGPPYGDYDHDDLDKAYRDYYALGHNHVPMRTVGQLLTRMWTKELISEEASEAMLSRLSNIWSSGHRIRGAIPEDRPVLHKTGTQHKRICDLSIVMLEDDRPLILAIAVEGIERLKAEKVMFAVAQSAYRLANDTSVRTAQR